MTCNFRLFSASENATKTWVRFLVPHSSFHRNMSNKLQFLSFGFIICVIILMTPAWGLTLNYRRPSTVYGVQRHLFNQKLEKNYFRSWDGSYHFNYDTGNVQQQMFRNEKRYADGTVIGFFGYIDPEGVLRITEYIAGRSGYKQRTVLRYPVLSDL